MADDLSARAAGSMGPTGQGDGVTTNPVTAMTAPGSAPASNPGAGGADGPAVKPDHFAASNRVDGGELTAGARWDETSPEPWRP